MKTSNLTLLLLLTIINISCNQTTTLDQVSVRNGIVCKGTSLMPFTGTIKDKATADRDSYEGQFVKGRAEGLHKRYDIKDSLVLECNYEYGEFHGSYIFNHINGTEVFNYKNGVKDGEQFEYYDHQRTKEKFHLTYKNGELDGEWYQYYENGNIENSYIYKDGKLNGEHVSYTENGILLLREYFVDGKLNGLQEKFYNDGTPDTATNYKDAKIHGKYFKYFSDGKIMYEIDYVDHKKHGKDIMYNGEGKAVDVRIYEHGKRMN